MHTYTLLTLVVSTIPHALALTASDESQFSSAASQLISLYIPASAASAIISVASQHSVHGTPAAVLESAFTATATPSWLTASALDAYQPNIQSLDGAISQLRAAASLGSISGAPRVVTSTGSDGVTIVATREPGASGSSAERGSGSSGGSASSTGSASSAGSASSSGVTGGASSGGSSLSSTLTTTTGSSSSQSVAAGSTTTTTSSSSGMAAATMVPFAAAGVVGLLGVAAAL